MGLARLLEAADLIDNEEHIGENLAIYLGSLGSVGGARPKASVRTDDGVLWLAKFPSKSDRACNAVLEAGALELARAAGLGLLLTRSDCSQIIMILEHDRHLSW